MRLHEVVPARPPAGKRTTCRGREAPRAGAGAAGSGCLRGCRRTRPGGCGDGGAPNSPPGARRVRLTPKLVRPKRSPSGRFARPAMRVKKGSGSFERLGPRRQTPRRRRRGPLLVRLTGPRCARRRRRGRRRGSAISQPGREVDLADVAELVGVAVGEADPAAAVGDAALAHQAHVGQAVLEPADAAAGRRRRAARARRRSRPGSRTPWAPRGRRPPPPAGRRSRAARRRSRHRRSGPASGRARSRSASPRRWRPRGWSRSPAARSRRGCGARSAPRRPRRCRAAPPPRARAPSSASARAGAAARAAARRPRSRGSRARPGRSRARRCGPRPGGRARAAAGPPGPAITASPDGASTSTMRNQRPQPGVPSGAVGRGACSSRPAVTGWRWPTSETIGRKPSSITRAVGVDRQDLAQRRAVEALGAGEVGAGGDQQRAAVADVAGDVLEVVVRQDAAALVAVEDDQVELVDLLHEQLLGREGDQRELEDRHEVLLLRRAQDGEMHEVDRASPTSAGSARSARPDRARPRRAAPAAGRARR